MTNKLKPYQVWLVLILAVGGLYGGYEKFMEPASGSCTDENTLRIVRKIINTSSTESAAKSGDKKFISMLSQGQVAGLVKLDFEAIRTTAKDAASRTSSCAAQLRITPAAGVAQGFELSDAFALAFFPTYVQFRKDGNSLVGDIVYTGQPTDDGKSIYASLTGAPFIGREAMRLVVASAEVRLPAPPAAPPPAEQAEPATQAVPEPAARAETKPAVPVVPVEKAAVAVNPSAMPSIHAKHGIVTFLFAAGQSELAGGAVEALADIANGVASGKSALVSTYFTETGNDEADSSLAKRRSFAVRDAPSAAGVPQDRMTLKRPEKALVNHSAAGRIVDVVLE